jgi:hypothetical protein
VKKHIIPAAFLLLAANAGATTLLSNTFETTSSGSVPGWTEIGTNLWGGVGVEYQGANVSAPFSFDVPLTSDTTGNLFVQFYAATSSAQADQQPRLDNVLVTSIPEPTAALLGGLGLLTLVGAHAGNPTCSIHWHL